MFWKYCPTVRSPVWLQYSWAIWTVPSQKTIIHFQVPWIQGFLRWDLGKHSNSMAITSKVPKLQFLYHSVSHFLNYNYTEKTAKSPSLLELWAQEKWLKFLKDKRITMRNHYTPVILQAGEKKKISLLAGVKPWEILMDFFFFSLRIKYNLQQL